MKRRAAVALLCAVGLPVRVALAQDRKRSVRIGVLVPNPPIFLPRFEDFRQGMRELGYVEGKNLAFEFRRADGNVERLPALASELVRSHVDLIFTASAEGVLAAMRATRSIPIVFGSVQDPVASGIADSLARPGKNATGLSIQAPELARKRLEVLKEMVPAFARVGFLWSPVSTGSAEGLKQAEAAARDLSLELRSLALRTPEDFDRVLPSPHDAVRGVQALVTAPDPLINANAARIVAFGVKNRVPVMYAAPEHVRTLGGLVAYAPNYAALWKRAATFVDRILGGAKPGELPIEQPTEYELVVNKAAAAAIGLAIPASIRARAETIG